MHTTKIGPAKDVTVGTSPVLVSAEATLKRWVKVQALTANTGLIYVGDVTVTTAQGFGELVGTDGDGKARGDSIELETSAAVYCISGTASQHVRVLEGFA